MLFYIGESHNGGYTPARDEWFKPSDVWPKAFTDDDGKKTNTDFMECVPPRLLECMNNEGEFLKNLQYRLRGRAGRYGDYLLEKSDTTGGGSQLWRVTKSSCEKIDTYISQK